MVITPWAHAQVGLSNRSVCLCVSMCVGQCVIVSVINFLAVTTNQSILGPAFPLRVI